MLREGRGHGEEHGEDEEAEIFFGAVHWSNGRLKEVAEGGDGSVGFELQCVRTIFSSSL